MSDKSIMSVHLWGLSGFIAILFFCCNPTSKPESLRPPNPLTKIEKGFWVSMDNMKSCLLIKEDSTVLYQWAFEKGYLSETLPLFAPINISFNDSLGIYTTEASHFPTASNIQDSLVDYKTWEIRYDHKNKHLLLTSEKDTCHYKYLIKESSGLTSSIKDWQKQINTSFLQEESDEGFSAYFIFTDSSFKNQYSIHKQTSIDIEKLYRFAVKLQKDASDYQVIRDKRNICFSRNGDFLFIIINRMGYPTTHYYLVESIQEDQIKLRHLGKNGKEVYWNKVQEPSEFLQKTKQAFTEEMDRLR